MASIFDSLCGESGAVNQITEKQDQIREKLTEGKNAINELKGFIEESQTLADTLQNNPDVVVRSLQQDVFNILSEEALANPGGLASDILELRAAYQDAGAAANRAIDNIQAFVNDPLNTPLSLCDDIPNITKVGDKVAEMAAPAETPTVSPDIAEQDDLSIADLGLSDFDTLPRFDMTRFTDVIGNIDVGSADQAARG